MHRQAKQRTKGGKKCGSWLLHGFWPSSLALKLCESISATEGKG